MRSENDLDRELQFHIDERVAELVAQGVDEETARRLARLELGGSLQIKEAVQDQSTWPLWHGLAQDLRLAVRTLRATPIVTVVAILSLALGIGANTAIFSIVDSLLLRSLPVERPDRLVLAVDSERPGYHWDGRLDTRIPGWSNPVWEQIRERRHELFETAFAFGWARFNLAQQGQTDFVEGAWVSGDYFTGLGVRPLLGRTLTPADDRRGGGPDGPVAVIGYDFWQRRFGGAADIIGRVQTLDRVRFTIVGVMPAGFFGADVGNTFDVAVPIGTESLLRGEGSSLDRNSVWWLRVMARLKDGQTLASAQEAFRGAQPQIREATVAATRAEDRARYLADPVALRPAAAGISSMRAAYRQPLLLIMAVVASVLLIACANIANLLLARSAVRRHEFSVRRALGASQWRLVRQLLVEGFVLAGCGVLAGLAVAHWGSRLLVRQLSTPRDQVFLDIGFDWRVLAFTTAVAAATALLFGLVPARRASRVQPIEAIRERGRGPASERRLGFGGALVAGQIALSLVLVVAAGLFVRTFASLAGRNVGFDRDQVLIAQLDFEESGAEPDRQMAVYERIVDAARAVPGVSHVGMSDITPVSGSVTDTAVEAEHGPRLSMPHNATYINLVTPGWFATYGTPLVAGRDFDVRDRAGASPTVVVNESFARKFLAPGNPLGQRIRHVFPKPGPWQEVVGVAADATYRSLRDEMLPTLYVPVAQRPPRAQINLSVRAASAAPALLSRSLTTAIASVDPTIAITFMPLREQLDGALVRERLLAMLAGSFGALALLLAGLGLYGVLSYSVSRRRAEIGIRMALGAAPAGVVRLVVSRVSILVLSGLLIGVALSVWLSTLVAPLLFGLQPRDPITLVSSVAVLAIVGALAGWLPARRASRIDPATVLRES